MKFKSLNDFELGSGGTGPEVPSEAERQPSQEPPKSEVRESVQKVDRRPVMKKEETPGESLEMLKKLSHDELVDILFEKMMLDPEFTAKVVEKVNIGLKTEQEEQSHKLEEVDRERVLTSERTAAVLRKAKEDADRLRDEQSKKREDEARFQEEQAVKREEVLREKIVTGEKTAAAIKKGKENAVRDAERLKEEKRQTGIETARVIKEAAESKEPETLEELMAKGQ